MLLTNFFVDKQERKIDPFYVKLLGAETRTQITGGTC